MSQDLVKVEQGVELGSGLYPGVHEHKVPLWAEAENVEFREGSVQKGRGWTSLTQGEITFDDGEGNFDDAPGLFDNGAPGTALALGNGIPIRGVHAQENTDGTKNYFFGDQTDIFQWSGGATNNPGTGYSGIEDEVPGQIATYWSFAEFGDWTLATNGVDDPVIRKYSASSSFVTWANAPATAEIVRCFGPHAILFNTDDDEKPVQWAADGDPEALDSSTYVTAGSLPMNEMLSEIVAAEFIGGNRIMIYGNNEMHTLSYIRAPLIFGSKKAADGIGAFSKASVVPAPGMRHFGWGPSGIFTTDGVGYKFIDQPFIKTWVAEHLNVGQRSKIWGVRNDDQNRITWWFPHDNNQECSRGLGYNYIENNYTFYAYARTSGYPKGMDNYPVFATADGDAFFHEYGVNADGAALTAYATSKPLDANNPLEWKYVDVIRAAMKNIAGTGVQIQLGWMEELGDGYDEALISWLPEIYPKNGLTLDFVRESGVYWRFKLSAEDVDDDFILAGFELLGEFDGSVI